MCRHQTCFKMFVFDPWNTAGPISFGQTGSEYFEELCQTFNESVGFMPGLSYFVACPDRDTWVWHMSVWIKERDLKAIRDMRRSISTSACAWCACRKMWKVCDQLCELHRGRRFGDGLDCLVTCHASCGSDPRRAHGHLSHGTLAFDLAHGHIGKPRCEEIWYLKFYIKATWVLPRSQTSDETRDEGFTLQRRFPRIRSRFSSVAHISSLIKEYGRVSVFGLFKG